MKETGGFDGRDRSGPGEEDRFINFDCRVIDDPEERLDCYDRVTQGAHDYDEI